MTRVINEFGSFQDVEEATAPPAVVGGSAVFTTGQALTPADTTTFGELTIPVLTGQQYMITCGGELTINSLGIADEVDIQIVASLNGGAFDPVQAAFLAYGPATPVPHIEGLMCQGLLEIVADGTLVIRAQGVLTATAVAGIGAGVLSAVPVSF